MLTRALFNRDVLTELSLITSHIYYEATITRRRRNILLASLTWQKDHHRSATTQVEKSKRTPERKEASPHLTHLHKLSAMKLWNSKRLWSVSIRIGVRRSYVQEAWSRLLLILLKRLHFSRYGTFGYALGVVNVVCEMMVAKCTWLTNIYQNTVYHVVNEWGVGSKMVAFGVI